MDDDDVGEFTMSLTRIPEPDRDGVRRYGLHVKHKEDKSRCAVEVSGRERWPSYSQCSRPRGHGPGGMYCKQHDPATVSSRDDASMKRWKEKAHRQGRPHRQLVAYRDALRAIADGHNDPREIARIALETD